MSPSLQSVPRIWKIRLQPQRFAALSNRFRRFALISKSQTKTIVTHRGIRLKMN